MKILILGGGFQQLPAIRKAHELGLNVLLADYLPDAPGRREADQSFLVSTSINVFKYMDYMNAVIYTILKSQLGGRYGKDCYKNHINSG